MLTLIKYVQLNLIAVVNQFTDLLFICLPSKCRVKACKTTQFTSSLTALLQEEATIMYLGLKATQPMGLGWFPSNTAILLPVLTDHTCRCPSCEPEIWCLLQFLSFHTVSFISHSFYHYIQFLSLHPVSFISSVSFISYSLYFVVFGGFWFV